MFKKDEFFLAAYPERLIRNFRASPSGDQRTLLTSKLPIDRFWGWEKFGRNDILISRTKYILYVLPEKVHDVSAADFLSIESTTSPATSGDKQQEQQQEQQQQQQQQLGETAEQPAAAAATTTPEETPTPVHIIEILLKSGSDAALPGVRQNIFYSLFNPTEHFHILEPQTFRDDWIPEIV